MDEETFAGVSTAAAVADIWASEGEPAFRAAEIEVTRELVGRSDHVIALGGGTVMQPEARRAVAEAHDAKRIYLRCDAQVLASRIATDRASAAARPSLNGMGGGLEEVTAVLAERDPVYREVADAVFDVTHVDVDQAVAYLVRQHL